MCRIMPSMTSAVSLFAALSAAVTLMAGFSDLICPVTCRTFWARDVDRQAHGRPSLSRSCRSSCGHWSPMTFSGHLARARGGAGQPNTPRSCGRWQIDDGVFVGVGHVATSSSRAFRDYIPRRVGRSLSHAGEQVRHGPHQRIHAVRAVALIPAIQVHGEASGFPDQRTCRRGEPCPARKARQLAPPERVLPRVA